MGFIKLDRNIQNWKWYTKENMLLVWIELLTSASYENNYFDGKLIRKGQVVVGRKKMAKKLHLSEQSIRTCLNRLKSTGEITIKSTNKYSIITIAKWEDYQAIPIFINQQNNQDVNQQVTNKQPTSNQQVTTTKESIEVLESKESFNIHKKASTGFADMDKYFDEIEKADYELYGVSLFELFETEFGRPITQTELQRLSGWNREYEDKMIRYALREALTYEHKNFDYIDRILANWKEQGLTPEEYEGGKR